MNLQLIANAFFIPIFNGNHLSRIIVEDTKISFLHKRFTNISNEYFANTPLKMFIDEFEDKYKVYTILVSYRPN